MKSLEKAAVLTSYIVISRVWTKHCLFRSY